MGSKTRFEIRLNRPSAESWRRFCRQARDVILAGGLAVFPTETSYMLAADITQSHAVERLRRVKKRPAGQDLSVVAARCEDMNPFIRWNPPAKRIADAFMPGPLTLVVPLDPDGRVQYAARGDTLAFRVPALDSLRNLLGFIGRPVTATSANPHGGPEPYRPGDCVEDVDLVWDAGELPRRPPTTIVRIGNSGEIALVRPGTISLKTIRRALGTA